jgi:hypothetical protein
MEWKGKGIFTGIGVAVARALLCPHGSPVASIVFAMRTPTLIKQKTKKAWVFPCESCIVYPFIYYY